MPDEAEEHWKISLLTLPDTVFFALTRNYLGGITTPFNKHTLIERLAGFIRKAEIQERIVSLLDSDDRAVISLVASLGSVTPGDLYSVTRTRFSYGTFLHLIASLTERLLLYTDRTGDATILRVNPVLLETLQEAVIGFTRIFRCRNASKTALRPRFDEGFLSALLSFIHRDPSLFKADSTLKKKEEEAFRSAFPGYRFEEASAAVRALASLGILFSHDEGLAFHQEAFQEFLGREDRDRRIRFSSAFLFPDTGDSWNRNSRNVLFTQILESFPGSWAVNPEDFQSYLLTCALRENTQCDAPSTAEGLLLLGAFYREPDGYIAANPGFMEWIGRAGQTQSVFQPNFDLLVPEEPSLKGFDSVPALFHLKRFDRVAEFHLNQDSFISFLDIGGTTETAVSCIQSLTGQPVPPNTETTLRLWEEKYRSIRLYEGTVLKVLPEMRPYLEHSPAFRSAVRETLAPGLYFFGDVNPGALREVLSAAGVSHPPGAGNTGTQHQGTQTTSRLYEPLRAPEHPLYTDTSVPGKTANTTLLKDLKESLGQQNLSEVLKKEYSNRIERRLILDEAQFSRDLDPPGQREARGIDFSGKLRLIQEALVQENSLLEIPQGTGSKEMLVIKPLSLSKDATDQILTGLVLPEEEKIEMPVRKISRIRLLSGYLVPSVR